MGAWKSFRQTIHAAIVVLAFVPAVVGCGYDYTALQSHRTDGGLTGTGGTLGTSVDAAAGRSGGGKMEGNGGSVAPSGNGAIGGTGEAGSGAGGNGETGEAGNGGGGTNEGSESGAAGHGRGGVAGGGEGGIGGGGEAGIGIGGGGEAGIGIGIGGGGEAGSPNGGRGGGGQAGSSPLVLSIDFVGGRWSTGGAGGSMLIAATTMDPSEVAGVKPAARWNSAPGPGGALPALVLSSGAVTTAIVIWTSPPSVSSPGVWTKGFVDAPGDVRMMNGYLDPLSSSAPATVVVAGLPDAITSSGYDVYVYTTGEIQSGSTRTSSYTIGTTSITESEVGPTPTTFTGFTQASTGGRGNYVVFKKVTGASFILIAKPGSAAVVRAPVNGIQIVSPSGS